MGARILVVDDEEILVKGLTMSLQNEGYETVAAYDGLAAREQIRAGGFDLVILDLMLPEIDGLTLCREIRSLSNVPVIMLTARGDDVDKIIGLEMGADDYLAKPFNMRELLARIKAVLRRSRQKLEAAGRFLEKDDLTIDQARRSVVVRGQETVLTGKEYDLLLYLAKSPGRVFTRDQLLRQVWGYDFIGEDRTVDVHIRRLREKIEAEPGKPCYILTRWGVGYYFADEG